MGRDKKKLKSLKVYESCIEEINLSKLHYLIENYEDENFNVENYEKLLRCAQVTSWPYGIYDVSYVEHSLGHGRLIPQQLCFILMSKKLRATLIDDLYLDIDMVNAHPTILRYLCERLNITCVYLSEYVSNRDNILDEHSTFFGSKEKCKEWFLQVLYGGGDLVKFDIQDAYLMNYYNEINSIKNCLLTSKQDILIDLFGIDISKIRLYINQEAPSASNNVSSKIFSHVLFAIENIIREKVCMNLRSKEVRVIAHCFDGMMVKKAEFITDEFLKSVEYICSLKIKSYESYKIEIPADLLAKYDATYYQNYIDKINFTYEFVKKGFEECNFFALRDVCYYTEEPFYVRGYTRNEFVHKYEHLTFFGHDTKGNKVEKSFITEWMKDPSKRVYEITGLYPPGCLPDEQTSFFSKWKGFAVEHVIPNGNNYAEEVNIIRNHTRYICSYNEEYVSFLEKCIKHILVKPGVKLDLVIAFKAVQGGEGKNTWWEIHKELFGGSLCYSTQQHERDWFGDFNELIHEKIWLHMEEMNKTTLSKFSKSFLAYITSKYDTLNFKGGKKKTVPSFANYFITFNTGGIDMFPGLKRRLWIHELDKNIAIHDSTYFNRLYSLMKQPQVMRAYYDYLITNVDVENFNPAESRPFTPYMEKLFAKEFLAKNSCEMFFSEVLPVWFYEDNIPNEYRISFKDLFKMYVEKCKEESAMPMSIQKFVGTTEEFLPSAVDRKTVKGKNYLDINIDGAIDILAEKQILSWKQLGSVNEYTDCVYIVHRPCKKTCKFKTCKAHMSYVLNDEVRAIRYYRNVKPQVNVNHLCECLGSYFIGNHGS